MKDPHDNPIDFGPNLFHGDSENLGAAVTTSQINPAVDGASDANLSLATVIGEGNSIENPKTSATDAPSVNNAQTSAQPERPTFGVTALASTKAAVKLFESLIGHDGQGAAQRIVIRELMAKQATAMNLKLEGEKPPEGEDFDSISKLLRRENNRLDNLLEGKEAMFEKARKATLLAIQKLQEMDTEITRMEEEG